jgi:NTP pyrophosphatase (non-canonical NTP hydrolase)
MDLRDYQQQARAFAFYPSQTQMKIGLIYNALKMSGEIGEFNDKLGKCISDKNGIINDELKEALLKELGDILWHLTSCADELGVNLDYVAMRNLGKLADRMKRKTLSGDGDNR